MTTNRKIGHAHTYILTLNAATYNNKTNNNNNNKNEQDQTNNKQIKMIEGPPGVLWVSTVAQTEEALTQKYLQDVALHCKSNPVIFKGKIACVYAR